MSGLALALYGAFLALTSFPLIFESMQYMEQLGMSTLSYLSATVVPVLLGVILWLFPSRVASTIIQRDIDPKAMDQLLIDIETIAIRLMGLILLYHCISNLTSNYLNYKQAMSMNSGSSVFMGSEIYSIGFYVTGIETVMAIGLIIGSKGIVNLVHKIRYAS